MKLQLKAESPNTEVAEIGAAILAFVIRLSQVREKLDAVENVYIQFVSTAPDMIDEGKKWLQGR